MVLKKGGQSSTMAIVIFIVLNLIVFSILSTFVVRASTGALVYEKVYAKELAFLIDSAKPGTDIKFDFSKGVEIAEENNLANKKSFVKFDNVTNSVLVRLSTQGGYSMNYFTDYNLIYYFVDNDLIIKVREKNV